MNLFNIDVVSVNDGFANIKIGFGDPAGNDAIVVDAAQKAKDVIPNISGNVALINGPASLPVAMVLSHAWAHVVKAIAVFDPKLNKHVVSVTHDPAFVIGQLI